MQKPSNTPRQVALEFAGKAVYSVRQDGGLVRDTEELKMRWTE